MNRYTLCGESFLVQNSGTEIFEVGNATNIDYVKVKWLSGVEDILTDVTPNQTLIIVEDSTTLSTVDIENYELKIFPNPSAGIVYFQNYVDTLKVTILDVLGRKMDTKIIDKINSSIDLSFFSKGIYFLSIQTSTLTLIKK